MLSHHPQAVGEEFSCSYGVNIAVVTGLNDRIVAINAFRPQMPNRDFSSH